MELAQAMASRPLRELLAITAGGLGTSYISAMIAMRYLKQKEVRRHSVYVETLRLLAAHPDASAALGPPIAARNVALLSRENFITHTRYQMGIPVSGSKDSGTIYVRAIRDPDAVLDDPWSIVRLELALDMEEDVFLMLERPDAAALLDTDDVVSAFRKDDPELCRPRDDESDFLNDYLIDALSNLRFWDWWRPSQEPSTLTAKVEASPTNSELV